MNAKEEASFITHLIELRSRLVRALVAIGLVFIGFFPFADRLYTLLAHPLLAALPKGGQMIATEVTTPFFVPMKVALVAAFLVALPYVLYQVWSFVAPGLYRNERRLISPLVVASTVLFFCGMAFAYFVVFPIVFTFITHTAPHGVAVMTDISKYLDFVLTLFLAFGMAFEVPIAVILLIHFGVVTPKKLKEMRPYIIVGAFVMGAIFTPPDVMSQTMLALPLWLLFEAGIFASRWVGRAATSGAADESAYEPPSGEEMERELDAIDGKPGGKGEEGGA